MINKIISKFINFGVLLLCLLVYPFRGDAKRVPSNPRKIAILRRKPHMGDIVYVTPMFRAVKNKYPTSKLILVGGGRAEEVVRHNPDIDEYINYDNNFWEIIKRLRGEKIDFACLGNGGSTLDFAMLYLAGIKGISVFSLENGPGDTSFSYSIVKKMAVTVPFYTGRYVPPQYLGLLAPLGANSGDAHFRLYFSKEAEDKVKNIFVQNNISADDFIVAFVPGGAVPERWWQAERFAELAKILYKEHNAKILLVGAGKDGEPITTMRAALEGIPAVNLFNQNLDEFKATISKCALVVGNDSGSMVTADAFDVANLVFVGPTDEREYHRPPGPLNRVLKGTGGDVKNINLDMAKKEIYTILNNLNISNKQENFNDVRKRGTFS